ncbi:MAG: hypothetical protein RMJ98_13755, partial [Myxococcales bacterium]|nr:hypothetical protein [Polyangiaceae bacterium]MDW8250356.1 hypothetical protein [Myxococcales bacterium]
MIPRRRLFQLTASGLLLAAGCSEEAPAEIPTPSYDPDLPPSDGATAIAFSPESIPEDTTLFPLGVQAGAMTPTSVLLWGYVEDDAPCTLRVWRDSDQQGQVWLLTEREVVPREGYIKAT